MKVKIKNDVISVKAAKELLIYNMNTGKYLGLKGNAYHIWQCIESMSDKEMVISHMISEYEGDPETIRHDIDELIEEMVEQQLVIIEH